MRQVLDPVLEAETLAVGIWVPVGSRIENKANNGISHFLEHMAFKGTKTRSALQIANEMESVGGDLNAYTSREVTAYYARVLSQDVELIVDILSDILQNSVFDPLECERERGVILQEIGQSEDDPDDIVGDYFQQAVYGDSPMGRPILGPSENITRITPQDLKQYMADHYCFSEMVFSASGNVKALEKVDGLLGQYFTAQSNAKPLLKKPAVYEGGDVRIKRDLEQVHLILGFNGVSVTSEKREALALWSAILGGGMASRLFQEVREKKGLVYSIHSHHQSYTDAGVFNIEAGASPHQLQELSEVMAHTVVSTLDKIYPHELDRVKKQACAGLIMSRESLLNRCEQQAHHMLIFGRALTQQEITERINAVTIQDVQAVAEEVLKSKLSMAAIGNVDQLPTYNSMQRLFQ